MAVDEPSRGSLSETRGDPPHPFNKQGNGDRQRRRSVVSQHQLERENYASLMMETTGKNKLYKDIEYVKSCSL